MISEDLKRLLAYAAPYRRVLGLTAALMVAASAAGLGVPWLAGKLTSVLTTDPGQGWLTLEAILVAAFGLLAAQAVLQFAQNYLSARTAERILADLRMRIYDHLQSLPLGYFQRQRQGDVLALLTTDVGTLSQFVSGTLLGLLPIFVTFFGAFFLMFRLEPVLSGIAAVLVVLLYGVMKILGRRLRPIAQALRDEHAAAVAIAEENLTMLPAIKAFTREEHESSRYQDQMDRILRVSERQRRIQAAMGPSIQLLGAASIVLVLWLASRQVAAGELAPGELVSFLLYGLLLTRPVSALANSYGQIQRARGSLHRLFRTLDEPAEPLQTLGRPLPPVAGAITFQGVSFAYPDRPPALDAVDLHIAAGETVALTGPNGGGKSTIAHLLMRFHAPDAGVIRVDGVDIAGVSLASLREQIGLVPQHILLFNGTVRDNIAYGRPDPSQADIEAAAQAARAHAFIKDLPEGYDTLIGDRGVRLSGGQQQRIALARALLKDPPILILDEATAMFDPAGEIEFLEECADVLHHRTVILITHRPASLALADRIVKVEDGHVTEQDTHVATSPA